MRKRIAIQSIGRDEYRFTTLAPYIFSAFHPSLCIASNDSDSSPRGPQRRGHRTTQAARSANHDSGTVL
jgi:hypothetical protein